MRHPVVAIVGGGFSGAATAIHLLALAPRALEIVVVEPAAALGRGLAYSTASDSHRLNVPAGRLGIDPAHEAGFIEWLKRRDDRANAADFVPRRLLGEYVGSELASAVESAATGCTLAHVRCRAEALGRDGAAFALRLSDGRRLRADHVVLATGHLPPAPPGDAACVAWTLAGMTPDPWHAATQPSTTGDILIVGSGLTAIDLALQWFDGGHAGRVHLLSRRGLLPQPHRVNEIRPPTIAPVAFAPGSTLRETLTTLRQWIACHERQGGDWRDAIASLRAITPALWQGLDLRDRRRFLRHLQSFWDSHRHRFAPELHARVQALRVDGRLTLQAGRLARIERLADGMLRATWRPRGGGPSAGVEVARVINGTGPSADLARASDPLLASLRDAGTIRGDALGQGLLVDDALQVLDAQGHAVDGLFYVGPMLKAQCWEAVAIPELRMHARAVARGIVERLVPA